MKAQQHTQNLRIVLARPREVNNGRISRYNVNAPADRP